MIESTKTGRPGATQIDLTGGESVYCINTFQMEKAMQLFAEQSETGSTLRETIGALERDLTRNEQAALAMIILQRLRVGPIS